MSEYTPIFSTKATGHVTATFKESATPQNIANIVEWIKKQKWKGCLQVNCAGNGGVTSVVFSESPKALRDDAQTKSTVAS